jgi:hypothetical protein
MTESSYHFIVFYLNLFATECIFVLKYNFKGAIMKDVHVHGRTVLKYILFQLSICVDPNNTSARIADLRAAK